MKRSELVLLIVTVLLMACTPTTSPTEETPAALEPTELPTRPALAAVDPPPTSLPLPTQLPERALSDPPADKEGSLETPPTEKPMEIKIPPEAESLVAKAKEMVIETDRTAVAEDEIAVVSVEWMQWRDSSLGCPREGMMYLQVITAGYLIRLEADGSLYEFHTNTGETVVLCTIED
jgi:hypothetical protein